MPKVLPKKMKDQAQKLYLEGKTISEVYEELVKNITPVTKIRTQNGGLGTKFCDGDTCTL